MSEVNEFSDSLASFPTTWPTLDSGQLIEMEAMQKKWSCLSQSRFNGSPFSVTAAKLHNVYQGANVQPCMSKAGGSIHVEGEWGGPEGFKMDWDVKGSGDDKYGNRWEAEIGRNSNGTWSGYIDGDRDEK